MWPSIGDSHSWPAQRPGIHEFSPRNTWFPLPAKGQSSLRLLWQWHLSEVERTDPSENMREMSWIVMIRYEWYDFLNPYIYISMLSQHLSSPNSLWDPPAPCTSGANKWDPLSIAPKAPRTTAQPPLPAPRYEKRRFPWQTTPSAKQRNGFENPEFVETLSLSPHIANLQQQQGWRHAPAIKIIKVSIIRTASAWRHGWFSFYHMMSTWWSCWSNTLIQPFISMCPRHHLLWQQKSKARDQSGWLLQVQWLRCAPFPWRSAGQFFRLLKMCHTAEVSMMWFIEPSKDSTPSTWTLPFLRSFRPDLSFYL